jgi:hypothetical protein
MDQAEVPIDDYSRMESFVQSANPDILFHLAYASDPAFSSEETWKINYEWASELAWISKLAGIKFLFTSTNLVSLTRRLALICFTPYLMLQTGMVMRKKERKKESDIRTPMQSLYDSGGK